jgi:hypothetical protein
MIKDTYLPKIEILAIASTPLRGLQFEKGGINLSLPPPEEGGLFQLKLK